MIYKRFNLFIKDNFFSTKKMGEKIIFSIDESILNEFFKEENISYDDLKNSISEALQNKQFHVEFIDNCFAICAIQVYIASQMQTENEFSRNQYNPRLSAYLSMNVNKLQEFYSKYQDIIWGNLKLFCNRNNFQINIPFSNKGKGRYIQYPFSQVLLNKEDLKEIPILFEKSGIKKTEYFSFEDFFYIIKNADKRNCMSSNFYRVKERLIKEDCIDHLYQQIYNYFINDWDGSYPKKKELNGIIKHNEINDKNFHLFLNRTYNSIIVLDEDYEKVTYIDLSKEDIYEQINKYQKVYNDNFLIFKICSFDDPEYVRYFDIGEKYIIICNNKSEVNQHIRSLGEIEDSKQIKKYNLYFTKTINNKYHHPFWNKFFSLNTKNYKIEGGVKLSYKSWMYNCGPKIILNEVADIWVDGKKFKDKVIDCKDYPIGTHKIVYKSSIEKFEIEEPKNIRNEDCLGWNIDARQKKWNPVSANCQNTGLIYNFPKGIESSTIRNWISLFTTENKNKLYSSTILNAIKRKKYGI